MGLTLKLQEVTGQRIDAEPASRSKIQSLEGHNLTFTAAQSHL
jgi:hypothetical protein